MAKSVKGVKAVEKQPTPKTKEKEVIVEDEKVVEDVKPTKKEAPKTTTHTLTNDGIIEKEVSFEPENTEYVTIEITYPDNWKRRKYFKNGDIVEGVLLQNAQVFVKQGFAKIIK